MISVMVVDANKTIRRELRLLIDRIIPELVILILTIYMWLKFFGERKFKKMVEGCSYKTISDSLLLSAEELRIHFKNIYKKMHLNTI